MVDLDRYRRELASLSGLTSGDAEQFLRQLSEPPRRYRVDLGGVLAWEPALNPEQLLAATWPQEACLAWADDEAEER